MVGTATAADVIEIKGGFKLEADENGTHVLLNMIAFLHLKLTEMEVVLRDIEREYKDKTDEYHEERRKVGELTKELDVAKRIIAGKDKELEVKQLDNDKLFNRVHEWEEYNNLKRRDGKGNIIPNKKPKSMKKAAGVLVPDV